MGRRTAPRPDQNVFAPIQLWGHVLPGPACSAGWDSFDARVEQAWAYMKGAFFAVEEHERLRMVLGEKIEQDRCRDRTR